MVMSPVSVPEASGVKVTSMVQLPPDVTLLQVLVCAKSPVTAMLVMVSVLLPRLVRVTTLVARVVPVTCLTCADHLGGEGKLLLVQADPAADFGEEGIVATGERGLDRIHSGEVCRIGAAVYVDVPCWIDGELSSVPRIVFITSSA